MGEIMMRDYIKSRNRLRNSLSIVIFITGLSFFLMSTAHAFKYKAVDEHEFEFWGFAQLTAEARDDKNNDNLNFGTDRVRAGVKWKRKNLFAGIHVDLNNTGDAPNETLDRFIRDLFVMYSVATGSVTLLKLKLVNSKHRLVCHLTCLEKNCRLQNDL